MCRAREGGQISEYEGGAQVERGSLHFAKVLSGLFGSHQKTPIPSAALADLSLPPPNSMAAAAPKTLASDSLEVTRSSHMLGLHEPTPHTKKALSASSLLLQARAEKKLARQQKNAGKRAVAFDGEGLGEEEDDDEGMESESGESELDVAAALREADMGDMSMEADVEDKVKSKVKVGKKQKSALRRTGGGGMGMQVDA